MPIRTIAPRERSIDISSQEEQCPRQIVPSIQEWLRTSFLTVEAVGLERSRMLIRKFILSQLLRT
jgi:hypothetical protein